MNEFNAIAQSLQNNEKDDFRTGVSLAMSALIGVCVVIGVALLAMYVSGAFASQNETQFYCEPTITPSVSLEPSVTTIPTALLEPSVTPFHPSATPFHPSATPFHPTPTDEPLPTVCPGRTKGGLCPKI